jgi:hypothetical protein
VPAGFPCHSSEQKMPRAYQKNNEDNKSEQETAKNLLAREFHYRP